MYMAKVGVIPPHYWKDKAEKTNSQGNTVAMLLILNGIRDIPKEWCHKATLKNING